MKSVVRQVFDFTADDNMQKLKDWENAFALIPLPKKSYWIEKGLDKEDAAVIALKATYQFVDVDEDTWFWISVVLFKDGTAGTHYLSNYSIGDEDMLLPIVNKGLKAIGFKPIKTVEDEPVRSFKTWQNAYDFMCDIAHKTKIPEGVFKSSTD